MLSLEGVYVPQTYNWFFLLSMEIYIYILAYSVLFPGLVGRPFPAWKAFLEQIYGLRDSSITRGEGLSEF